jgi:heme A synthase
MTIQESRANQRFFRNYGVIMIVLLCVQYVLGMINNLYVQFPEAGTEAQMWEFAWKQFSLASHIILGIILLLASVYLLIRAMRFGTRSWFIPSLIGLFAILVAGFSGAMFIPAQENLYSLIMSIAFLMAMLSYVWGILRFFADK